MPQQIDKYSKLIFYLFILIFLSSAHNLSWIRSKSEILKINSIEVTGLKEELNYNIEKELLFLIGENILFVDGDKIINELNKIKYIENYKIKKFFPSKLKIKIKKTKILAQAYENNKKYYIGSNKKKINFQKEIEDNKYPTIYGEFSIEEFINLRDKIFDAKFNIENVTDYYYFQSNRWDIKLKNGTLIKLPKKNINIAITLAKKIITQKLNNQKKIIDLRVEKQIILSNG